MATATIVQAASATTVPVSTSVRMKVDGTDPIFGDWRDDLARDGYAVVKGAIPQERALDYANKMYSLIESFGLGYDRNDPSTDFVWAIRGEPGVVNAFEKVYDDEDLIVSFDTINYGFANRTNLPANKPWPHQDQDPDRPGFRCLQGLVNLLPNGPNDGGLIVCKGSHALSEKFHDAMRGEERIPAWTKEWYGFTDAGMKWLADNGCEWIKVEAGPGDLLLWDSRTAHYNVPATGTQDRLAIYTCYMPVAEASQDDLIRKKAAWEARVGTTHWPNALHSGTNVAMKDGKPFGIQRDRPLNDAVLNERTFKLTGIPYIKAN
ncbi:unnamed protein product [Parascedosporium putredinis]|uniref:Phytanoyl-CoA dioxygenase n=1 Tax=Parascedosporium putredinis TaxID=1442378 RepID=A0A9P1HBX1_9PEZI|nr:unnamed protein product [Parascedosporium putredinis]CAI8004324.1 unnamed protein product [Parascedosporium putredinis]